MKTIKVLGIDLAGSEKRKSGWCLLDLNLNAIHGIVYKDEEIIRLCENLLPDLVIIDAPLTLPKDRVSIESCEGSHLRECDKAILKMGIKIFPITLGPMKHLTKRGIKIRKILENNGFNVLETYPGAVQDILQLPRKGKNGKNKDKLYTALKNIGIKGINENVSHDELDAITCAYVGILYIQGKAFLIGKDDGKILIPKMNKTLLEL